MRKLFAPNIERNGCVLRGLLALALAGAAAFAFILSPWLGLLLAAAAAFVLFEALRNSCAARACGVKARF
jgi:predicted membrane-bound spermidine synthase